MDLTRLTYEPRETQSFKNHWMREVKDGDKFLDYASHVDRVVLITGASGSGKSTFINLLFGAEVAGVEDGSELSNEYPRAYHLPDTLFCDNRIILVEIPGFDISQPSSQYDLLRGISVWLCRSYQRMMEFSGIIYCHDITASSGWSGPTRYNLDILCKLCGPEAASRTIVLTTKWDHDDAKSVTELEFREDMLKATFWSHLVSTGAVVHRMHLKKAYAQDTIDHLLTTSKSPPKIALLIQTELVDDNKRIPETSAGRELIPHLLHHRLTDARHKAKDVDTIIRIEREIFMIEVQFGTPAKAKLDLYRRLMSRLKADKAKAAMFRSSGRQGPTKSNEIRLKELQRIEERVERIRQEMDDLDISSLSRLKVFFDDLPQRIVQKIYVMVDAN
ncbi:hypothetical protein H0H92_005698 [Tricholoma furcatifolium]|nr:hypothetical protein H0H92_005698 [Tricholoma furcatifolium]